MNRVILLVGAAALISGVFGGTTLNYQDYGLPDPTSSSCPGTRSTGGDMYFVDRAFGSSCFVRQVECGQDGNPTGNVWMCDDNQFYDTDNSNTCHSPGDTSANCDIQISCGKESIGVYVYQDAIWSQTADPLVIGTAAAADNDGSTNGACQSTADGNGDYMLSVSLADSEWSDCGVTRSMVAEPSGGDGLAIKYSGRVVRDPNRSNRIEQTHGAKVTRERCFMLDWECYYNLDGTVTSSFQPSSPNILDEHDEDTLTFDMDRRQCDSRNLIETDPVCVDLDPVCYRTYIETNWHDNIRISTRYCWATPTNDPDSSTKYHLADRDSNTGGDGVDNTFNWDCGSAVNEYEEHFSFDAFRFQAGQGIDSADNAGSDDVNDPDYTQTIYIHCDVVACENSDTTSGECDNDCNTGDERRARRAIDDSSVLSTMTKSRVATRAFVLPRQSTPTFIESSYNYMKDALVVGMFAVGCVLGIVAIGMMVVLRQTRSKVRYGLVNSK